jgi:hypothetical protein
MEKKEKVFSLDTPTLWGKSTRNFLISGKEIWGGKGNLGKERESLL